MMITKLSHWLMAPLCVLLFACAFNVSPAQAELINVILPGTTLTPNSADPWGLGGATTVDFQFVVESTDITPDVGVGRYNVQSVDVTINGVTETSVPGAGSTFTIMDFSIAGLGDQVFLSLQDVEFNGGFADINAAAFFGEFVTFANPLEDLPFPLNLSQIGGTATGSSDYSSVVSGSTLTTFSAVPEPGSFACLSIAATLLLRRRRIG